MRVHSSQYPTLLCDFCAIKLPTFSIHCSAYGASEGNCGLEYCAVVGNTFKLGFHVFEYLIFYFYFYMSSELPVRNVLRFFATYASLRQTTLIVCLLYAVSEGKTWVR